MTTTISDGSNTLTATALTGYEVARPSRNVLHRVLGSNAPAVTLREAGLRTGKLQVLFADETIAWQAHGLLSSAVVLTLADTNRATIGMSFVASGDIEIAIDDTRKAWLVTFEFEETG